MTKSRALERPALVGRRADGRRSMRAPRRPAGRAPSILTGGAGSTTSRTTRAPCRDSAPSRSASGSGSTVGYAATDDRHLHAVAPPWRLHEPSPAGEHAIHQLTANRRGRARLRRPAPGRAYDVVDGDCLPRPRHPGRPRPRRPCRRARRARPVGDRVRRARRDPGLGFERVADVRTLDPSGRRRTGALAVHHRRDAVVRQPARAVSPRPSGPDAPRCSRSTRRRTRATAGTTTASSSGPASPATPGRSGAGSRCSTRPTRRSPIRAPSGAGTTRSTPSPGCVPMRRCCPGPPRRPRPGRRPGRRALPPSWCFEEGSGRRLLDLARALSGGLETPDYLRHLDGGLGRRSGEAESGSAGSRRSASAAAGTR